MDLPEIVDSSEKADSFGDSKVPGVVEKLEISSEQWDPPNEWLVRLVNEYGGHHDGKSETLPPGCDPQRAAEAILTMNEQESVEALRAFIDSHQHDYTFDNVQMRRLMELVEGHQACEMQQGEWAYVTCKMAGLMHNWSPYAEVRAVTLPYDDPDEACESFRAYVLGFFWVCVCTAINTCELCSTHPCL